MKKTLLALLTLLLSSSSLFSQSPLKGTLKYEIKDLSSEETKKQMEQYGITMPTHMEIASNGTDARMRMLSSKGIFMEVLQSKGNSYIMDRVDKKAYKMEKTEADARKNKVTVTKTEEFETIVGHKCRKYIVEEAGKTEKQYIWATPDYKFSSSLFNNANMGGGSYSDIYANIDGIPLKMIVGQGSNKVEMKAVSLTTTVPLASDLSIASDYTVAPFNPMVLGQMMMRGAGK